MKKILIILLYSFAILTASAQDAPIRVTKICGISFGSTYEVTKDILIKKFGDPDTRFGINKQDLYFTNILYAGIVFDSVDFLFQSDGRRSFFNGCIFIKDAKNLDEAIEKREMLYKKLSAKYSDMIEDIDQNGNKFYIGGLAPNEDRPAFVIDIVKYDDDISALYDPYSARIYYGPYNYVQEDF